MPTLKFHVTSEHSGQRLDVFLAAQTQKSRTLIQEHFKAQRITLNSRQLSKVSVRISPGDEVSIELHEEQQINLEPVKAPLNIIFEDEHLLVINKSQGVVIHPAAGHRGDTLVHHLLHYLGNPQDFINSSPTRPGIVHRLDKGTTGVLLIAKNRAVQDALSNQFKNREVKKVYECLVWGPINRPGVLKNPIGRDKIHRKKMSSKTSLGRTAETRFSPAANFRSFTHLMVFPLTGRTHQIRVHLSEFGHSILGDPLYGKGLTAKRSEDLTENLKTILSQLKYPLLHASQLTFTHPISKNTLEFNAPKPNFFNELLAVLERENPI